MKFLILFSCIWILASTGVHAIVDTNANGVSDIWERQYNSGALLTNLDPQADPDGDGWTNAREAAAGTDPFDPQSAERYSSSRFRPYPRDVGRS